MHLARFSGQFTGLAQLYSCQRPGQAGGFAQELRGAETCALILLRVAVCLSVEGCKARLPALFAFLLYQVI